LAAANALHHLRSGGDASLTTKRKHEQLTGQIAMPEGKKYLRADISVARLKRAKDQYRSSEVIHDWEDPRSDLARSQIFGGRWGLMNAQLSPIPGLSPNIN
jgi:hypothetical protein